MKQIPTKCLLYIGSFKILSRMCSQSCRMASTTLFFVLTWCWHLNKMFFLGSPLTLTYKIDDPLVIKMFVIPLHGNREGGVFLEFWGRDAPDVLWFQPLYYYIRNFCNLIGLEQWYFSSIWNTYMWKLQTFCG